MTDIANGIFSFICLALTIGILFSACENWTDYYTNEEDMRVNQCTQQADQSPYYKCLRYSVYEESDNTCSCVLQGSGERITFPNKFSY